MGWVDLVLDVPLFWPANSAILLSAQAELGRKWKDLNQCQPNPAVRPPAPPCIMLPQVFIPSWTNLYGSAYKEYPTRELFSACPLFGCPIKKQQVMVSKTTWRNLNSHGSRRCNEEPSPDVAFCITQFIEEHHGCRTTLMKTNKTLPFCNLEQIFSVDELTIKISNMDEAAVYTLTGCLPPCEYDEFFLKEGPLKDGGFIMGRKELALEIVVPNGRYEEREQYIVYDSDSFIADVGGFLGLLLGHSMLSLYQLGAQWIADGKKLNIIRKFLR